MAAISTHPAVIKVSALSFCLYSSIFVSLAYFLGVDLNRDGVLKIKLDPMISLIMNIGLFAMATTAFNRFLG